MYQNESPYLITSLQRVENTACSGVVLTNYEVFGNVVKHGLEYLMYLRNRN